LDLPVVDGGHRLARREVELAELEAGHVVHGEDGVDREALEQAVGDHRRAALHRLLAGLEDQPDGPVELPGLGQVLARREQHRRVPVVTAQVRDALDPAAVRQVVVLPDGQGVEVGAQADGPAALTHGQGGDDAVLPDARHDLVAPRLEALGDVASGGLLPHRELGVAVHVLEPRLDLGAVPLERREDPAHAGAPSALVSASGADRGTVTITDTTAANAMIRFTPNASMAASRTATLSCLPR